VRGSAMLPFFLQRGGLRRDKEKADHESHPC
jgi:hypothetical protein